MVIEEFKEDLINHLDNQEVREQIYEELPKMALIFEPDDFSELLNKLLQYPDCVNAIKSKWKILINNAKAPEELLELLKQMPEMEEELTSNILYLIEYANIDDTGIIASKISGLRNGKQAITDNFDELLEFCFSNYDSIFCSALETEKGRALAKENFGILKKEAPPREFFNFIRSLKGIKEFEEEYEEYSFWAELYKELSETEVPPPLIESDDEYADFYQKSKDTKFLSLMNGKNSEEKKIILQRVSNGNGFSFKSMGSTSIVIQTGDQIIKFGTQKVKFEVPYHPRIMMPYFRKKYDDDSFIEVYNWGNVESAKINDEELLKIYKELEQAGIKWGDARKENVLVLEKDNNLPEYIVSDDFNVMGFLEDERYPTTNHKVLKKGDLVICDLDYLFAKDDPSYHEGLIDTVIGDYLESKKRKRNIDISLE